MKPLQMLLIFAFGVLAGALLFKSCGKPVKQIEWVKTTDTVRLVTRDTFIKIPKPDIKYVIISRDTGQSYTYVEVDTVFNFKVDTVRLNEVVAARNYKDSIDFSGKDVTAILHYELLTTGEMLSLDMDMDLFNSRIIPPPIIPKRLKNSINLQGGYFNQWFAGIGYGKNGIGGGLLWGFRDKTPGVFTQLNIRF